MYIGSVLSAEKSSNGTDTIVCDGSILIAERSSIGTDRIMCGGSILTGEVTETANSIKNSQRNEKLISK